MKSLKLKIKSEIRNYRYLDYSSYMQLMPFTIIPIPIEREVFVYNAICNDGREVEIELGEKLNEGCELYVNYDKLFSLDRAGSLQIDEKSYVLNSYKIAKENL